MDTSRLRTVLFVPRTPNFIPVLKSLTDLDLDLALSKPFKNMWLKPMKTKNPKLYHYTLIDVKYHNVMSVLCVQNIYKPNAPNTLIT